MRAHIRSMTLRADGSAAHGTSYPVDAKESPLPWQVAGLTYTATGYGTRIPTRYVVRYCGKWRRVYCRQYSNAGTCFIGTLQPVGENIIVEGVDK